MSKKEFCPVFDSLCPYCTDAWECLMPNPEQECDDYYFYYAIEEEDETEA